MAEQKRYRVEKHLPDYAKIKAGGASYQIVYRVKEVDGPLIGTVADPAEGARLVKEHRGRIKLTWSRTIIGRQEMRFDFTASFGDEIVGRVNRPGNADAWNWSLSTSDSRTHRIGSASGQVALKDEAAAELEQAFTDFLAWTD